MVLMDESSVCERLFLSQADTFSPSSTNTGYNIVASVSASVQTSGEWRCRCVEKTIGRGDSAVVPAVG